jgi:hypothetical protein
MWAERMAFDVVERACPVAIWWLIQRVGRLTYASCVGLVMIDWKVYPV